MAETQVLAGPPVESARTSRSIVVDANEAVARVAHRISEVIAIYPITPSSAMAELCDEWSAAGRTNLWGQVPDVIEMQSEGGAAGAVHGALQGGALATTFTASQGLLLMLPNMYKIAGELNAFCMHVAARALATNALSIFGDHSDVMACRGTGFALLCSGSPQEAQDLALVAHAATLRSRVPFLHFFDGFRTSHEERRVEPLADTDLAALVDEARLVEHRARRLTPDRPVLRGTAANPDTFFQTREASNLHYEACPGIVQAAMDELGARTGRRYRLCEYVGHPTPERVLVMMGSGAEVAHETVERLVARGEKVGLVKLRLYRPFPAEALLAALPAGARSIAVLDRTKEPGAFGEPLFLDVVAALAGSGRTMPRVIGGRYGLGSKEFSPAMVKAVLDELAAAAPRPRFTVGIVDDVTQLSLPVDPDFDLEDDLRTRALFWGLGSDGTVSANKSTIKIIGAETDQDVQGYYVYDSKKSGAVTVSHLRFGPGPIRSSYQIGRASFVACHQFDLLGRYDVLAAADRGAKVLINAPYGPDAVWDRLPAATQRAVLERELELWVIDAHGIAREAGLGGRISAVMQMAFFAVSGALPRERALAAVLRSVEESYGKKGEEIVRRNREAVGRALEGLHRVTTAGRTLTGEPPVPPVPSHAPDFVRRVTAALMAGQGDLLPVSAFPVDGTWPTGTARWEKRNLAREIPAWDPAICIQCNKCAEMCPHAAIRAKLYPADALTGAPSTFLSQAWRGADHQGSQFTIQVAPEDCTGCGLCVAVCPAKDKGNPKHKAIDMALQAPRRDAERENYAFFLDLPEADRASVRLDTRGVQLLQPLFESSGACAGCGETPYLKLLSQLYGDRVIVANATGCSSIYGGNLPTTPWSTNSDGRGPAWSNSLFEDNAEFGLGLRLAADSLATRARALLAALAPRLPGGLVEALLAGDGGGEAAVAEQRQRVVALRGALAALKADAALGPDAARLDELADALVRKSVWIVGGDGWAYDIGFGGLDHVLSTGRQVKVLVLDTEVYSNTGGQASKATPLGAAAKFAAAGKELGKKDLGLMAMAYGHVYVARVAIGARDSQTLRAFQEADAFPGPALIIAYSPCIAHGYDLVHGAEQQKLVVESGMWPLYRFDPRRTRKGEPPLEIDSGPPRVRPQEYMRNEMRFRMVERRDPQRFARLTAAAEEFAARRLAVYAQLSAMKVPPFPAEAAARDAAAGEGPSPGSGAPAGEG